MTKKDQSGRFLLRKNCQLGLELNLKKSYPFQSLKLIWRLYGKWRSENVAVRQRKCDWLAGKQVLIVLESWMSQNRQSTSSSKDVLLCHMTMTDKKPSFKKYKLRSSCFVGLTDEATQKVRLHPKTISKHKTWCPRKDGKVERLSYQRKNGTLLLSLCSQDEVQAGQRRVKMSKNKNVNKRVTKGKEL